MTGPPGATGATGATGISDTGVSAFAANTTGAVIAVILVGTLVPLPSAQNLGPGITMNPGNTIFTIAPAGRYYITYQINLSASVLVGSRLIINGSANLASTVSAIASTTFNNDVIVTLPASSTVSLQLFGLLGAATLLGNGAGAAVTIIRLSS